MPGAITRGQCLMTAFITPFVRDKREREYKVEIIAIVAERLNRAVAIAAKMDPDTLTIDQRSQLAADCIVLVVAMTEVGLTLLPIEYVSSVDGTHNSGESM